MPSEDTCPRDDADTVGESLDLSSEQASGNCDSPNASLSPDFGTKHFDPMRHHAKSQRKIAQFLLWVLAGCLLGGAALVVTTRWTGLPVEDAKDVFSNALTAVIGIVGAVTGYYFAATSSGK